MTLKELAHAAQQHLETQAGLSVRRSHVHELMAAAFGYGSWAAFRTESLLADGGVGDVPSGVPSQLVGRALQLGYEHLACVLLADALMAFMRERTVSSIRWAVVRQALSIAPPVADQGGSDDDDDGGRDDEDAAGAPPSGERVDRPRLLESQLLLDGLEHWAEHGGGQAHHRLAILYRCRRPNPYLYQESRKGRALTRVEQAWVDDYLVTEPRFRKYEFHLKAAALGGVRAAAVEYAGAFDSQEFFELAERMTGGIDADRMARIARTPEAQATWLRNAAEGGSSAALQQLARGGDTGATARLAERGDVDALRTVASRAAEDGELVQAWTWQYLAQLYGVDLTESTMRAYHDGGPQDGQFYDSDFGGSLYVDGAEGLRLLPLGPAEDQRAKSLAREIHDRAR